MEGWGKREREGEGESGRWRVWRWWRLDGVEGVGVRLAARAPRVSERAYGIRALCALHVDAGIQGKRLVKRRTHVHRSVSEVTLSKIFLRSSEGGFAADMPPNRW